MSSVDQFGVRKIYATNTDDGVAKPWLIGEEDWLDRAPSLSIVDDNGNSLEPPRMSSGHLINWKIDSQGNLFRIGGSGFHQTGDIDQISAAFTKDHIVTAFRDRNEDLRLSSWVVHPLDKNILHRNDSGPAGRISLVSMVTLSDGKIVTAIRDGNDDLALTSWDVDASIDGRIVNLSGPITAGRADIISMVPMSDNKVITAIRDGSKKLVLTMWSVNADGSFVRLADSLAETPMKINAVSIVAISNNMVVTAISDEIKDLRIISWHASPQFGINRLKDSGPAGRISLVSMVTLGGGKIVTAIRDGNDDLALTSWHVSTDGGGIRNLNGPITAGRADRISAISLPGNKVITAIRDGGKKLMVTSWSVNTDGSFVRLGDSLGQAGRIGMVATVQLSADEFSTIIREEELQLNFENYGDFKSHGVASWFTWLDRRAALAGMGRHPIAAVAGEGPTEINQTVLRTRGFMGSAKDWKNVEITLYFKINDVLDGSENGGQQVALMARGGARHGKGPNTQRCEGTELHVGLGNEGTADVGKELYHAEYANAIQDPVTGENPVTKKLEVSNGPLFSILDGEVRTRWIGIKGIIYNKSNGNPKVELWIDQLALNDWGNQPVLEYEDKGFWTLSEGVVNVCNGDQNEKITWGGPAAIIRWDNIPDIDIRYASIREIIPPS